MENYFLNQHSIKVNSSLLLVYCTKMNCGICYKIHNYIDIDILVIIELIWESKEQINKIRGKNDEKENF